MPSISCRLRHTQTDILQHRNTISRPRNCGWDRPHVKLRRAARASQLYAHLINNAASSSASATAWGSPMILCEGGRSCSTPSPGTTLADAITCSGLWPNSILHAKSRHYITTSEVFIQLFFLRERKMFPTKMLMWDERKTEERVSLPCLSDAR